MNRISMQNRLVIGIISTLIMLFVVIFPSELTDTWESAGFQGFIIAVIILIAAIQIAALSKVFKPIAWIEALPLLLAIILIWTSLFVVAGSFQIAPGSYRYIEPSYLLISVPMFMLIISAILAVIMLLAPTQDRRYRLKAQEAVKSSKAWVLSRVARRTVIAGFFGIFGVFFSLDVLVRGSMVGAVNSCIEERFQQGWRSAYLNEPWRVPLTWSAVFIEGYEEWGDWWVTPPQFYSGPTEWDAFVAEVSTAGIPITVVKNGYRTPDNLIPKTIEDAYMRWEGFNFDQYVRDLKTSCMQSVSAPLFPISSNWEYGDDGVKNSISDIDGYLVPVKSATP